MAVKLLIYLIAGLGAGVGTGLAGFLPLRSFRRC